MPFVRIYLKQGTTKEFRHHISRSVHQALVSEFSIPEDDLFQIISELPPENIVFPHSYMGISHTDNIIFIQITAKSGRSQSMKKSLYLSIVDLIHQKTGHNRNDILITLTENHEEDWSFGEGKAQLVP